MPELLQNNQSISFDIEANEADKKTEIKQEKSFKNIFKNKTNFQAPKNAQDLYKLLNTFVESLNPVKPKEKATFFRLLSVMINAGIPIVESLNTLSLQTTNPHLKIEPDDTFRAKICHRDAREKEVLTTLYLCQSCG